MQDSVQGYKRVKTTHTVPMIVSELVLRKCFSSRTTIMTRNEDLTMLRTAMRSNFRLWNMKMV